MSSFHSTDEGRPPKRAAVVSATSAQAAIDTWVAENRMNVLQDGDGMSWRVQVTVDHVPDHSDPNGLLWRLRLRVHTAIMPSELVAMGVLEGAKDARLLALIGDEPVDLSMKPVVYTAANEESLKLLASEELPKLRASFAGKPLLDVKRQLLGRMVDEKGRFGGMRG